MLIWCTCVISRLRRQYEGECWSIRSGDCSNGISRPPIAAERLLPQPRDHGDANSFRMWTPTHAPIEHLETDIDYEMTLLNH